MYIYILHITIHSSCTCIIETPDIIAIILSTLYTLILNFV